jgi:predicted phosphodiesterase
MVNNNKKIEQVFNLIKKHPGYYKSSYGILMNITGINDKEIIKLGKNLYRSVILEAKILSDTITTPGTYWVTGCSHAPWHNKYMYDATINYLKKEVKLAGIILAGDIMDANSLSAHDRGNIALPGVTLEWEYKESNKLLDQIDSLNCNNTYFLYGNHEDRYNRLIRSVDSSKYGKALKSPIEGLKLLERGYSVFTDWKNDSIKIGEHLDVNHGEFCNVHTAKKTIDTYRKSTLFFHTHRFQIFIEGNVGGFNMGSGADFTAPIFGYATRAMKTSWFNASALVTLDKDGFYHVQPLMFINNKLIVNGKFY